MKLKFSIRTLLILTAVVAVLTAVFTALGLEVGVMALFLAAANASISYRLFFDPKPFKGAEQAWLYFTWLIIGALSIAMIYGLVTTPNSIVGV